MEANDQERPPLHFGDYPRGAYWSAVGPESPEDNEDTYSVEGFDLRIMWDEGAGPLWTTEDGLLPDDPEWMKSALGLSDSLVADLLRWLHDMNAAQKHTTLPPGTSMRWPSNLQIACGLRSGHDSR